MLTTQTDAFLNDFMTKMTLYAVNKKGSVLYVT